MTISKNFIRTAAVAGFFVASAGAALAQDTGKILLEVEEAEFENVKTPDFVAGTKSKKWKQKDWLEMEVKFKVVKMQKPTKDKTLPKLTVKWYVAIKDPNRRGKLLRLSSEVKHVNIPVGEDMYTSVYISPSGVRRLSNGGDNASKKLIEAVGGEFFLDGKPVKGSKFSSKPLKRGKPPWWEHSTLSDSKSIKLQSKNETPFKFLWYDRYAEVETEENQAAPASN